MWLGRYCPEVLFIFLQNYQSRKMPISINDFIEVLAELCEHENLKCCVTSSVKGGLITGSTAVLGGLLLGPIGLAIGGALGGAVAAARSSGQFQSIAKVIRDMPLLQKRRLCDKMLKAFENFGVQDLATLAIMIKSQESLKVLAIREVTNYLTKDLALRVK